MDNLKKINNILNEANNYIKTDNYFYVDHICKVTNKNERVFLKTQIKLENNLIISFNICEHCNTIFYNEEYNTKFL